MTGGEILGQTIHRPRLSSKHAPMKEKMATAPPKAIPTRKDSERTSSLDA